MRKTLAFLIFFLVSFSSMCYFLFSGNDISVGFARERGVFNQTDGEYTDATSLSERKDDRAGYVTIPLPDDLGSENVSVKKDIYEKTITVAISPVEQDFYHKNLFSGEMNGISSIRYGYEEGTAYIVFSSEEIMEPVVEVKADKLFVKFVKPDEYYEHILVIDPGHGGDDNGTVAYGVREKDIVNAIAQRLEEKLSSENTGVYFTRTDDENISDEERLSIENEVAADLIVSIHTGADPKSRTTRGITVLSTSANSAVAQIFSENISESCSMNNCGWKDGNGINALKNSSPFILSL